jgi:predicted Rdx family selenoprotein
LKRVESCVQCAWFKRLILKSDELLSSFAFNFNMRQYGAGGVQRGGHHPAARRRRHPRGQGMPDMTKCVKVLRAKQIKA